MDQLHEIVVAVLDRLLLGAGLDPEELVMRGVIQGVVELQDPTASLWFDLDLLVELRLRQRGTPAPGGERRRRRRRWRWHRRRLRGAGRGGHPGESLQEHPELVETLQDGHHVLAEPREQAEIRDGGEPVNTRQDVGLVRRDLEPPHIAGRIDTRDVGAMRGRHERGPAPGRRAQPV
jgi:hypothetical protein